MAMRSVLACVLVAFGCEAVSPSKQPAGDPNEIVLQPSAGLPRFEIRATFDAGLDPHAHIQPVAAALAGARAACFAKDAAVKPGMASIELEVRDMRVHAESHDAVGGCLAHAIEGKTIDDRASYKVTLVVAVG